MTKQDQNINIRSQEIQEILGKFPGWLMRFGSLILLLLVVAAIIASAFVSFPMSEEATVSIRTMKSELELFPKQDGQLEQFLVAQDELVKKGQTVAILQSDALSDDIFLLASKLDSLESAPQLKEIIDFPNNLSLGSLQSFYNQFTKALRSSTQVQTIAPSGDGKLQGKLSELNKKYTSLQGKSKACTALLNDLNQKYFVDLDLYKKGEISKDEVDKSMDVFNKKKVECEALIAEINEMKSVISDLKNKIAVQSPVKTSSPPPVEKSYDLELQELQLAIINWQNEFLVLAPTEGYFQLKTSDEVRDSVKTNEALCAISQLSTQYELYANLSPSILQNVKLKQEVQITLDGYNTDEYDAILGVVSEIPQDCKEPSCKVVLSLPNGLTDLNGKSFPVEENYTGKVSIVSNKETLLVKAINGMRSLIQVN